MTICTLISIPIGKLPKSGVEIESQQIRRIGLSRQSHFALQVLCKKNYHRSWRFGAMAGLAASKTPLQLDKVVLTEYQVEKVSRALAQKPLLFPFSEKMERVS